MDITAFVTSNRDKTLGDFGAYRAQLRRQVLSYRKRLGRSTPKGSKFNRKAPVTAADVGTNADNARLLILLAERAWAHAMYLKAQHQNVNRPITGHGRSHMLTRLHKAASTARLLVQELRKVEESKASRDDILEASAYASTLAGSEDFEKQANGQRHPGNQQSRWNKCLEEYSAAHIIYSALHSSTKRDLFREVLSSTIEPSLRYAAHAASISRNLSAAEVAAQHARKDDGDLQQLLVELERSRPSDTPLETDERRATTIPKTITWAGRTAKVVDATLGQALATVNSAEMRLKEYLASHPEASLRENATAYDDVIIASQDAADATRRSIEDLEREHIDESDSRMQDLRVINLAVNYDVVAWRIGRNRMLIGESDGASFEEQRSSTKKRKREGKKIAREEPAGRKLARLRERVHLYEEILQSIDSVKELRGAARSAQFIKELDSRRSYFHALKCLNIGYSHSLLQNPKNALALILRAQASLNNLPASPKTLPQPPAGTPLKLDVSEKSFSDLSARVEKLVTKGRGLVELQNLTLESIAAVQNSSMFAPPLVDNLKEYPVGGADLSNLVTYPPRLKPIPVKPIFLDFASNYIVYPGQSVKSGDAAVQESALEAISTEQSRPAKKGWFGFGR